MDRSFLRAALAEVETVAYATLSSVQYAMTRQVSFKATMTWMRGIAGGQPPQNNCAQIMASQ